MMDLFLIRHAIAEDRSASLLDADRELTDVGRTRFEAVVQSLDRAGFRFDRVYHSPWTRAAQTAELLAPINDGPLVPTDGLRRLGTPDGGATPPALHLSLVRGAEGAGLPVHEFLAALFGKGRRGYGRSSWSSGGGGGFSGGFSGGGGASGSW